MNACSDMRDKAWTNYGQLDLIIKPIYMADEPKDEVLDKIKEDLHSDFPFAALWQDGEVAGGLGKILPILSVILEFIMIIFMIFILLKK